MKKVIALVLLALVTVMLLIPVSAAPVSTDILKGTPAVDGEIDDIYLQSASYKLDNFYFYCWGDATDTGSDATAYMLWDENYLYIAVNVKDSTLVDCLDPTGWQDDCAEMWFRDEDLLFKAHLSSGDTLFLGADGDGTTAFDFDKSVHAAKKVDGGYVTELALPMNNLSAGKTFGFTLQINDITQDDGTVAGAASGSQTAEYEMKCSASEAVLPVVETETAAEETVADTAAAETTASAPQTSDAVFAVLVVSALTGAYIVKKRK